MTDVSIMRSLGCPNMYSTACCLGSRQMRGSACCLELVGSAALLLRQASHSARAARLQDLARLLKGGSVEQHREVLEREVAKQALAGDTAHSHPIIGLLMRVLATAACAVLPGHAAQRALACIPNLPPVPLAVRACRPACSSDQLAATVPVGSC